MKKELVALSLLAACAAGAVESNTISARKPLFSPRIIHSGEGFDTFSDGYLDQVAAYGFNAILFYVWNAEEPRISELKDLVARAKKRGIDSYLYSRVNTQAFVHPDDPKAEAVFDATYGRIAAALPEAKGMLFVGESFEFPSKDERSCGRAIDYAVDRRPPGDKRPYVGWYPCRDYAKLVAAVKRSLNKVNPKMEVIFWSYNWGCCDEGPRRELIRLLPKDVSLLVTFEMFEKFKLRNGLDSGVADYSIAFAGPGKYFVSEAEEAKACGLKLYGMVNTACRTWDLGLVPYMPVPYQWKKRWDAMKEARRKWGLCGLVEGHHYGWTPNFVSELCTEALTEGGRDFDEHIRAIAVRDFGEAHADAALAVWKSWSDAIVDTKPSVVNQNGPFRYGPAYPFNALRPDVDWSDFALSPMFIEPNYRTMASKEDNSDANLTLETELLDSVVARFADGAARFEAMGTAAAREQARLGAFISRCYRTAANVKRGLMAERAKDEAKVLALARDEYENTKATIELVNADARLGYEPRMGRRCDERALKMKMKWMERHYFGGAVTKAEPYPEMSVRRVGQMLEVANESDRDFESGGLNVVLRDAAGREMRSVRLTSPLIRRGSVGRVRLPFDPSAVDGLRRLDLAFEQFEYGTVLKRTLKVSNTSNVRDFGAVGDGVTDDTAAIQSAIDAGGVVHFSPGTYLTGTLYLKSNGGLDISPGATIKATTDRTRYNAVDVCVQNYGAEVPTKGHLIMAIEQTNVVIRGGGTIDGNSVQIYSQYAGSYSYTGMGGIRLKKNPNWQLSQMLAFYECEQVRLTDLTLQNSCFWNGHLYGCEQVQIRGLNIKSDPEIAGDDGIDIDCCRRVTVSDCIIDVGDDGLTLRANGKGYLKKVRPCEYVSVANCSIRSAYAHAIRVGVGSGVIRHCTFSNITMTDTRCAIHMNPLYGERGTGVEMDDISFSDIHATAKMFIFLTLDYKWVGKNRFHGTMENIRFTNVSGEAKLPITIRGNGVGTLRNVVWKDSTVRFTDPSVLSDADKRFYMFDPAKPLGEKVQIDKAEHVVVRDVEFL